MELKFENINEVTLISINGSLDTNTSPEAESSINQSIMDGNRKFIIDLENTDYVSSAGLRIFLATAKKLLSEGGTFKLASPNSVVREILEMSGFTSILDVRDTREDALNNM